MPELAGLSDVVWNDNFIMAVPMMFINQPDIKEEARAYLMPK